MYFIPAIDESSALECNIFVNGEWMDELGITKMPVTTDEYYAMLKTFKEKKGADAVPLVGGPWYDIKANLFRSFKTINGWVMFKQEEGYVYAPYQLADNTKLALAYMNKLYSEGLMDKQYLDRDTESQLALIANNQAGSFNSWADGASLWCKGGTNKRDFRIIPPLQGSNGERWTGTKGAIGGSYFISSKCSDEVAQRILMASNYVFSPEGKTLFDFGVEGDTYTLAGGKPVFADKVLKHELGALNGRRTLGMGLVNYPMVVTWQGWSAVLWEQTVAVVDASLPYNMPQQPNLTGTEAEETELANIMTDIDKYVATSIDQFIIGQLNIEKDWPKFQAQLESMNIKRAIEIQNTKFDRWKNR
jgi:putative aldouronate transport system substrate-binding protein